jgi:uncharacterized membrane protein
MTPRPSIGPGILLGIGLGGFVDGIVLHQIVQWHHMVSDDVSTRSVAGLEDNTFADGIAGGRQARAAVASMPGIG